MSRKKTPKHLEAFIVPEVSKTNAVDLTVEKITVSPIPKTIHFEEHFTEIFFFLRLKMARDRFILISKGNPCWKVMSHFNTQKYI